MTKLTGKRRFRSERKWGRERLILQVEETGRDYDYAGGYVHGVDFTRWRDARTEDLTASDAADRE